MKPGSARNDDRAASMNLSASGYGGLLPRARMLAAGALAPGVVHEFANLLTIVDGARQLGSHGLSASSGQSLVDAPVQRSRRLVDAFRNVFAELAEGDAPRDAASDLSDLELLLRARLRGTRTHVAVEVESSSLMLPGSERGLVRLACLCGVLGLLERARSSNIGLDTVLLHAAKRGNVCDRLRGACFGQDAGRLLGLAEDSGSLLLEVAERLAVAGELRFVLSSDSGSVLMDFCAA